MVGVAAGVGTADEGVAAAVASGAADGLPIGEVGLAAAAGTADAVSHGDGIAAAAGGGGVSCTG